MSHAITTDSLVQIRTYPAGVEKFILVAVTMSGAMLNLICLTSVNVGLRDIGGKIGATIDEISWVITAYTIANVIMIPLSAMLSDLLGRKKYYTLLIATFTFASLMCGLSTNLWILVFWRFFQGMAGGGLLTIGQCIIIDSHPPEKMGQANALFGLCTVVGPTIGPTLGGYIIDNLAWNWLFLIVVPAGIIVAALSWKYIPDLIGSVKPAKIDWLGIILLILFVGPLQYVLAEGNKKDWFDSSEIVVLLVLAIISAIGFVWRELSVDCPAVNIRLYKNNNIVIGSLLMFVAGVIVVGTTYLFPIFVQLSLGWTATMTGVFMIPGALASAFGMIFVGKYSSGRNPKIFIIIGFLMAVTFLIITSFSSPNSSGKDFFFAYIIRGLGTAFIVLPIFIIALAGLHGKTLVQASGLVNMVEKIGGAVSVVLINIYVNNLNATARAGMVDNFSEFSNTCVERISMFSQSFFAAGYSPENATSAAYKMTDLLLMRQQQLLSYTHGFLGIGIGILACIPIVFMVKYKKSQTNLK